MSRCQWLWRLVAESGVRAVRGTAAPLVAESRHCIFQQSATFVNTVFATNMAAQRSLLAMLYQLISGTTKLKDPGLQGLWAFGHIVISVLVC